MMTYSGTGRTSMWGLSAISNYYQFHPIRKQSDLRHPLIPFFELSFILTYNKKYKNVK